METIITCIKAELWYLFLQQLCFICRKIHSMSFFPFSPSAPCSLQSTALFSLFLVGSHLHSGLATRLSLHICLCGHAGSCQTEQGREHENKPCQSKPAITSAQHQFLPSRDFQRIQHVHRLKCILAPKQLPLCQSCSVTKHLTKLMKHNRNPSKMYSVGPHD